MAARSTTRSTRTAAAKPAAKATPAARKTNSRATTKAAVAPPVEDDDDDDMLSGLQGSDSSSTSDDDESMDLLSQISEDAGTPWMPHADGYDDQPKGIQGTVQFRGTVSQDEKYGGGEVNYLEILDQDGETLWSVRGYASVLDSQIDKKDPQVGQKIAILYRGLRPNRKGDNDYHDFGVAVGKRP